MWFSCKKCQMLCCKKAPPESYKITHIQIFLNWYFPNPHCFKKRILSTQAMFLTYQRTHKDAKTSQSQSNNGHLQIEMWCPFPKYSATPTIPSTIPCKQVHWITLRKATTNGYWVKIKSQRRCRILKGWKGVCNCCNLSPHNEQDLQRGAGESASQRLRAGKSCVKSKWSDCYILHSKKQPAKEWNVWLLSTQEVNAEVKAQENLFSLCQGPHWSRWRLLGIQIFWSE